MYYYYDADGEYHILKNKIHNAKPLRDINYNKIIDIDINELTTIEYETINKINKLLNQIDIDNDKDYKKLCRSIQNYNFKLNIKDDNLNISFNDYSHRNHYIKMIENFYNFADKYKFTENFTVFRKFSPSEIYDPHLRIFGDINKEIMYSVISTSYKYHFPLYEWGSSNGCLYIINVNKDCPYVIHNYDKFTQYEITLAPGLIYIKEIKKLNETFIFICDYQPYNLKELLTILWHK